MLLRTDQLTAWFSNFTGGLDVMGQVLGLHGIAQEQKGRSQLLDEWRPGLSDGVEAAGGLSAPVPSFDLCFYGNLFLSANAQGALQPAGKAAAATDPLSLPLTDEDVAFLEDVVGEVEAELPELAAAMGAPPVPKVLRALAMRLTRRMDSRIALQTLGVLRQVKRYLDDQDLADTIRGRLVTALDEHPHVVIAHSLGTVVAVDTLRLNPHLNVPTLVTVGSPLGMRAVQSRLQQPGGSSATPQALANVARWVNIYDPGDPVAAAGGLSWLWPAIEDYTVGNGRDPHNIRAYLGKKVTGQAVLDGVDGPQQVVV